ncbi:MAG TPA: sulfatase-like hydrolase/transferase [Vicinamibacteria bacterium]|nr:sulfatase-like hydrolase/transferase [Vicinamibacteria bacterium]
MRRLALLAALLAWPAPGGAELRPGALKNKSVVLVSIDTLRADHLGAYGYPRPTSPNLDALAAESVVFERCNSHSPKTASSHMSLMTGVLPAAHGVLNWGETPLLSRPEALPTLASLLKRAGYRTAAYTSGGNVAAELGFDHGFDAYVDAKDASLSLARLALEDLARERRPFFLFVHTYAVHDPYTPPEEHARLFVAPGYAGRIVASRERLGVEDDWWAQHRAYWARVGSNDPADRRHLVDLYDGAIRAMDAELGLLLGRMRALVGDDALLVVLSDHGEEFQEHGQWTHNSVYDEVLHVPLFLRFPGGRDARRVSDVVRLSDVMPTLLDLVGVSTPEHVQGASLLGVLEGADRQPRQVLAEWAAQGLTALRLRDLKYVSRPKGEELYDLLQDPGETRNLLPTEKERAYALRLVAERVAEASFALKERLGKGGTPRLDPETRRQLEALGYVGP